MANNSLLAIRPLPVYYTLVVFKNILLSMGGYTFELSEPGTNVDGVKVTS